MKKIFIAGFSLVIFFTGCKNSDSKKDDLKAKADSARQSAIDEHDKGMGGWTKIEGRQKQIQNVLDSIASLPAKVQPTLASLKEDLKKANAELSNAYKEMHDWMGVMSLDSAANNPEARIQYYNNEKLKGSKITEMINTSLQKADSLIKAKF